MKDKVCRNCFFIRFDGGNWFCFKKGVMVDLDDSCLKFEKVVKNEFD